MQPASNCLPQPLFHLCNHTNFPLQVNELRWPRLTKMVKQYFSAPASSAGVERVFSAAGKMHSDLRKSLGDSSLQHSIFACFNTE